MLTKTRKVRKMRAKVFGSLSRPRLMVYRSNKFIYAQLINDEKGVTLAEAHGTDAKAVGGDIAQKAKKAKVTEALFDRSGFRYHGKVKSLADAAREGGLKF